MNLKENQEELTLEFRHIHVLKRLLLETYQGNFGENYSYAVSIVNNIDPIAEKAKRQEGEEYLAKIKKLGHVPISMKKLMEQQPKK